MINVVIPMAGAGSRFAKAGFVDPKPLIAVSGVPMIRLVIDNIRPACEHRFIFICQSAHLEKYPELKLRLRDWSRGGEVVAIDGLTEGAACTVLAAKPYIDNANAMMIANSDQYVDIDIDAYLAASTADGLIMTMPADDPKWSFVAKDGNQNVTRVVEKEVISNEATVGIYNFARGRDFVSAAESMIARNERVNGEFYVAPVYNELISKGAVVRTYDIGSRMHGIGTPDDLAQFLKTEVCERVTRR